MAVEKLKEFFALMFAFIAWTVLRRAFLPIQHDVDGFGEIRTLGFRHDREKIIVEFGLSRAPQPPSGSSRTGSLASKPRTNSASALG